MNNEISPLYAAEICLRENSLLENHPAIRLLGSKSKSLAISLIMMTFDKKRESDIDEDSLIHQLTLIIKAQSKISHENDIASKKEAHEYLSDWISNDATQWFIKTVAPDGKILYKLSDYARPAINMIKSITSEKNIATDSLFKELAKFTRDTAGRLQGDPDVRMNDIAEDIKKLQREFDLIGKNGIDRPEEREIYAVIDKVVDFIHQAEADFNIVRNMIDTMILDNYDIMREAGEVDFKKLERAVENNENIKNSQAYKSLKGFLELIQNYEAMESFELYLSIIKNDPVIQKSLQKNPKLYRYFNKSISSFREIVAFIIAKKSKADRQLEKMISNDNIHEITAKLDTVNRVLSLFGEIRDTKDKKERSPEIKKLTLDGHETHFKAPLAYQHIYPVDVPSFFEDKKFEKIKELEGIELVSEDNMLDNIKRDHYCSSDSLMTILNTLFLDLEVDRIKLSEVLMHFPLNYGAFELKAWLAYAFKEHPSIFLSENRIQQPISSQEVVTCFDPIFVTNDEDIRPGMGVSELAQSNSDFTKIDSHSLRISHEEKLRLFSIETQQELTRDDFEEQNREKEKYLVEQQRKLEVNQEEKRQFNIENSGHNIARLQKTLFSLFEEKADG